MHREPRDSADAALQQELTAVLQPIERANGLPNRCYTDEALFRLERARLFEAGWACIGFASDIPQPGDAMPVDLMGLPLLTLRDHDDMVRVFHNVCRHRGMKLVSEPTKLKALIVCPYHAWTYKLDGALRGTPHIGGTGCHMQDGFERADHGLVTVRAAVWFNVIFVNLSGEAEPFEEFIRPLADRWTEFRDVTLAPGGADSRFGLELACNWKLAVENYCEAYHLPMVHPELNRISKIEDHYNIVEDDRFSGQGTTAYRANVDADGRRFVDAPKLSDKWREGGEYVALYPNVLLGVHRDHCYAIVLLPTAPDRLVERVAISFFDPSCLGDEFRALREANTASWTDVFREDVFAVEGMQQGRASPGFDGGVFSTAMDPPTHAFHKWVAKRMLGEPSLAAAAE